MSLYVPAVTPPLADKRWLAHRPRFADAGAALSRGARADSGGAAAAARVPTARDVAQLEAELAASLASVSRAPAPRPLGVPAAKITSAGAVRASRHFSGSDYDSGEEDGDFDDDDELMDGDDGDEGDVGDDDMVDFDDDDSNFA